MPLPALGYDEQDQIPSLSLRDLLYLRANGYLGKHKLINADATAQLPIGNIGVSGQWTGGPGSYMTLRYAHPSGVGVAYTPQNNDLSISYNRGPFSMSANPRLKSLLLQYAREF